MDDCVCACVFFVFFALFFAMDYCVFSSELLFVVCLVSDVVT